MTHSGLSALRQVPGYRAPGRTDAAPPTRTQPPGRSPPPTQGRGAERGRSERSTAGRRPRHPGRDSSLTNPGHKKQPRVGGAESRRSPPPPGSRSGKRFRPATDPGLPRHGSPLPSWAELGLPLASPGSARDLRRGAKGRRSPTRGPECFPRRSAAAAGAAPHSGRGLAAAPWPRRQLRWAPRESLETEVPPAPSPAAHRYLSAARSARPPRPLRHSPSPRCPPAAGPWPGPTPRRRPRAAAPHCEAPRCADRRGRTRLLPPSTLRGARRGEIGRDGTERTAPLARSRDPPKPDPKLRTCRQQRMDQHRPPVHGRAQRPGSRSAQPRSAATLRPRGPAAGRRRWGGAGRGWGPPLLREGLPRGSAGPPPSGFAAVRGAAGCSLEPSTTVESGLERSGAPLSTAREVLEAEHNGTERKSAPWLWH